MKAAIYTRVSTEDQEREGTSLQSQLEACLKYCQEKDYNVSYRFSEAYSGLMLDRPRLNELRELVRNEEIDIIVIFCLDRLSRDPTHGVIITQELEKHNLKLESVTEDIDNSELGKLISYIRGFAAKLEAEKIRERSMRGIRQRVKDGRLPGGRKAKIYGYDYLPGKGTGEGVRYINEGEAKWVREIFRWYTEEGLTINGIVYRLRALTVPTPCGNSEWKKAAIHKILKRRAYTGKTYVYTQYRVGKAILTRPTEEWVELPNVTPPLITEELFNAVQARFKRNKELQPRNTKAQYLLSGYLICGKCGRRYYGTAVNKVTNGRIYSNRYYRCPKNSRIIAPTTCANRAWNADQIESLVWQRIEALLSTPDIVLEGLKANEAEAKKANIYLQELDMVEAKLRHQEGEKDRAWKAFEITGDEAKFRTDIKVIMSSIAELDNRKQELQRYIEVSQQVEVSIEGIENFCKLARQNLATFSFEDKRLALEALQIRVLVDGEAVTLGGLIPVMNDDIASTIEWHSRRNTTQTYPFALPISIEK